MFLMERAGVVCFAGGADGAVTGVMGRAGDTVGDGRAGIGIQLVKMLRSLEMAVSCVWWIVLGAS